MNSLQKIWPFLEGHGWQYVTVVTRRDLLPCFFSANPEIMVCDPEPAKWAPEKMIIFHALVPEGVKEIKFFDGMGPNLISLEE